MERWKTDMERWKDRYGEMERQIWRDGQIKRLNMDSQSGGVLEIKRGGEERN
jgi:hypothetical protein